MSRYKKKRPLEAGASETLLGGSGVPEADCTGVNIGLQEIAMRGVAQAQPIDWPPRGQRQWNRIALAKNHAQLVGALRDLIPRLLGRGVDAEVIARDLAQLVSSWNGSPWRSVRDAVVVAPLVNECALGQGRT